MKSWSSALLGAAALLLVDLFALISLLGGDVLSRAAQILFYGPFLGLASLLRFARDSLSAPIPTTLFGGFPDWLNYLLLLVNWSLYAGLGFLIGARRGARTR